MSAHDCREGGSCRCYSGALEPSDNCPIHGYPYPPRCEVCGKFLPRPTNNALVADVERITRVARQARDDVRRLVRRARAVRDKAGPILTSAVDAMRSSAGIPAHVMNGDPCWCVPNVEHYKHGDVIIHREPEEMD